MLSYVTVNSKFNQKIRLKPLKNKESKSQCRIFYIRRPEFETNTEKLAFISCSDPK